MEYTLQAQNALEDAKRVSRQMHHHYIGTEHLLVGACGHRGRAGFPDSSGDRCDGQCSVAADG